MIVGSDLYGGIIVMPIRVVECCSVDRLIGCLMTTSPGRSCGALSIMFVSSICISWECASDMIGKMFWFMV